MKLHDLIVSTAEKGIKMQREDGSMPPGENGIYGKPETPVRNTSHWLMIFLKAYEESGEARFLEASQEASEYLLSDKVRPYNKTFHHRNRDNKDSCNGLIGQAWTIEALAVAGERLKRPELTELAEEVFRLHPFNYDFGVWKRVDVSGEVLGYDTALNHQIWFAASGSLLESKRINDQIETFLNNLDSNIETYRSGLIYHPIGGSIPLSKHISHINKESNREYSLRTYKNRIKRFWRRLRHKKTLVEKSIGYHSFNLYALAILNQRFSSNSFWNSKKFSKIIEYLKSKKYNEDLKKTKFGFRFNLVGFENALAAQQFLEDSQHIQRKWINKQLKMINPDGSPKKDISDPNTYQARIYEATRLKNHEIKVSRQK